MAGPDDIAASLPQPPPPAPARRETAIEAALRRFDGVADSPAQARRDPWWAKLTRPQVGALVTAAVVAVLGVPIALVSFDEWSGGGDSGRPAERPPVTAEAPRSEPLVKSAANEARVPSPAGVAPDSQTSELEIAELKTVPEAQVVASPPAPPPPAAPQEIARVDLPKPAPAAPATVSEKAVEMRARRQEAPPEVAAQAPAGALARRNESPADQAFAEADSNIIVTGARRADARASRRGDWNMCTVNDPAQVLRDCRHLVDPGAKGKAGRAEAYVADGLSLAWQGNETRAVDAFDQAIATSPRYAFAWLNRGLVRARMGDERRALADLDQAIRLDPASARNYYLRGQILRQQGNDRRARTDERRALELDPRYSEVLR